MAKTKARKKAAAATTTKTSGRIEKLGEIALSSITLSKRFNREKIDTKADSFKGLVASVKASGVIQPIAVQSVNGNGTYEVIAGERRYRAAKAAKLSAIPAVVRVVDGDTEAAALQFAENFWREDLTPFEEALQLQAQIDAGASTELLAKRIGKTRRYVQRRASITCLSAAWRKAMGNSQLNLSEWPALLLESIAKLPHPIQDALLKEFDEEGITGSVGYDAEFCGTRHDDRVPTVADLDRVVGSITHELSRAQWKRDDADLVPDAGACADCPKRGALNPLLWDGLADAKTRGDLAKCDICIDDRCWDAKARAFVAAKAEQLEAKHGGALVRLSDGSTNGDPNVKRTWEVTECKKNAKGAKPGIQVDGKGAGRTCWVQAKSSNGTGTSSSSSSKSKSKSESKRSLAEKRAENDQKRAKVIRKLLDEVLDNATLDDFEAALEPHATLTADSLCTRVMLSLVATFGTQSHYWDASADATWTAVDGLTSTDKVSNIHTHLWEDLRDTLGMVLGRGFRSNILEDPKQFKEDSERIARLIGADLEAVRAAAAEKYPEPKSWAKEDLEKEMKLK